MGAGASQPAGSHVRHSAAAMEAALEGAAGGGGSHNGDAKRKQGRGEVGGGESCGGGGGGGGASDGEWLATRGDVFGESGERASARHVLLVRSV